VNRIDVVLLLVALPCGVLCAVSTGRWLDGAERGRAELQEFKRELLASAGLQELHNKVAAEVGPRAWKEHIRPEFVRRITIATARETGDLLPDWPDVVRWVRAHPERTREILRECAR
jgi:hypothetical protein